MPKCGIVLERFATLRVVITGLHSGSPPHPRVVQLNLEKFILSTNMDLDLNTAKLPHSEKDPSIGQLIKSSLNSLLWDEAAVRIV